MAQIADTKALQLQISASTELLIRNLKSADQTVADFSRKTNSHLTIIDQHFDKLGAGAGKVRSLFDKLGGGALLAGGIAALGGSTLVELAKGGLEYASSLQEVSQQLGVTSKDLQVYRYAATQVGIDQDTMEKGLSKLTLTMGKAELGAQAPTKAFNAIGISLDSLKGKTAGDVIPRIADGLAKIGDPAQRAAIEVELFGKAGQKLDTLLSGGSGQINQMADAAQRLGLVLSSKDIAQADAVADKLSEVRQVLASNIASAVSANAAGILTFADALETAAIKAVHFVEKVGGAIRLMRDDGVLGELTRKSGDTNLASTDIGYVRLRQRRLAEAAAEYRAAQAEGGGVQTVGGRVGSATGAYSTRLEQARANLIKQDRLRTKAITEYRDNKKELAGFEAAARGQVVSGTGQAAKILAPPTPKGPKGKSAQQLADEATRNEKSYSSEEARAQQQLASVREQLARTADERLTIELSQIDTAKATRDKEIEETAKLNPVVAAHADHLRELNAQTAEAEKQVAIARRDTQVAQDALDLRLARMDDERDLAQATAQLALTTRQRRDAERRLIDLEEAREKTLLTGQRDIAKKNGDTAGVTRAQQGLDSLPDRTSAKRALADRQNAGPLDAYRNQLHAATDDMSEALENVKVHGLQSLEDGFVGVISGTKSVKSAFKDMAASIVADLAKIAIEKAIVSAIGGTGLGSLLGFAGGGKVPGFADGGPIVGPGGPRTDSILARVSAGEFIVNAASTRDHLPLLTMINDRRLPRFADGGPVGAIRVPSLSKSALRSGRSQGGTPITVNVDARGTTNPEQVRAIARQSILEAAPALVAAAHGQTMTTLRTPKLPGGLG